MSLPLAPRLLTDLDDVDTGTADADWIRGLAGADSLDGGAGADLLEGDAGDDTLDGGGGADTLLGGDGNDRMMNAAAALRLDGGAGIDTAFLDSATAGVTLNLAGPAATGVENVWGSGFNDQLTGNADANFLWGHSGNDTLDGGAGADTLDGGAGFDIYHVDDAGDVIVETAPSIGEVVFASVSWTLQAGINTLFLAGDAADGTGNAASNRLVGSAAANHLRGLAGDDYLEGRAGDDTLEGGAGRDTMYGMRGDDLYLVDDIGDRALEYTGGYWAGGDEGSAWIPPGEHDGHDTVIAGADHLLSDAIEDLILIGGARVGWGNGLSNLIQGSDADNTILGLGGNDTLLGGGGNDSLYGETGLDMLSGGAGADTLIGYDAGDSLDGGEGEDLVDMVGIGGTLDLAQGTLLGQGGLVLLTGIEHARGTGAADSIAGDAGSNSLAGDAGADLLLGRDGDDLLEGEDGQDTLDGGAGEDTLRGGAGGDIYRPGDAADLVVELVGGGADTLEAAASTTLAPEVEALLLAGAADLAGTGNASANLLVGNAGANLLVGLGGNDTLRGGAGDDTLDGGAGDNILEGGDGAGDVARFAGARADYLGSVADGVFTLAGAEGSFVATDIEVFRFADGDLGAAELAAALSLDSDDLITGTAAADALRGLGGADSILGLGGADRLGGDAGDDSLAGGTESDTLEGGDGADTLDGGTGADSLVGGAGDDLHLVDHAGDLVTEGLGAGEDTVIATVSYTLAAGAETLLLAGAATAGTGNAAANRLAGTDAANILDGGAGADTLEGGAGDDTYLVDAAGDLVVEAEGGGNDLVQAAISVTLGARVERLALAGTAGLSGTGNALANAIRGNAGANRLDGAEGDDTLTGGAGADSLEGGAGTDVAVFSGSFAGYAITHAAGRFTISGADGTDHASGIEVFRFADGDRTTFEIASKLPSAFADWLVGSAADDQIAALAGDDTAEGLDGKDLLDGGDGSDLLRGGSGEDKLQGAAGADTLDGGTDKDELAGGLGNDLYILDHAEDVVIETENEGFDTIRVATSHTLIWEWVEGVELAGSGNFALTGGFRANLLVGNAGANTLDGAEGADTLTGGAGNDTYLVDASDLVVETADGGFDTVRSAATTTLGAFLEALLLTGTASIGGTGNAEANRLTGNGGANLLAVLDGADTLDGAGGADTLRGGEGDDLLLGGAGNDLLEGSAGVDVAVLSGLRASYAVGLSGGLLLLTGADGADRLAEVEVVRFADGDVATADLLAGLPSDADDTVSGGSGADRLEAFGGNDRLLGLGGNDTLLGGDGNDRLEGGDGNDSMAGGAGDDLYLVEQTGDIVSELAGEGADTVTASVSHTLAAQVETLVLAGSANLSGTGNALANLLVGNAGHNTLGGAAGVDTLVGGAGNDVLVVDHAADIVVELAGEGADTVQSSVSFTLGEAVEALLLTGSAALAGTGNADDNRLVGNSGANTLHGGAGKDTLDGGSGNDRLLGGLGDDRYLVAQSGDVVVELPGEGFDVVEASVNHTLSPGVEILVLAGSSSLRGTGGEEDNSILGNGGANTLHGAGGADMLSGGGGADSLSGGTGGDTLTGGAGNDSLLGGAGADVFLFGARTEGRDSLGDFAAGEDLMAVSAAGFGGGLAAGGAPLLSLNAASGTGAQFVYATATGALSWDLDGTGSGSATQIAILATRPSLTAADIIAVA